MRIVLARIDDRFIHGQVTAGWSQKLRPDQIILANNEIAADIWQSRVYRSSVPPEIRVSIFGTSQTVAALTRTDGPFANAGKAILLTGNPLDMQFIHRHGVALREINIGGMHYRQGKRDMLDYVYVDTQDLAVFKGFLASGSRLWAQQVPGASCTEIDLAMIEAMEARL
jgi:PTS system mannose-specific IIB component